MKLDPLLQAMSELDEITRRIEALRSHLADAIVTMGDRRDLRAVIGDDEYTASMGRSELALAAQRRCGGIATDGDEPPSRTL